MPAQATHVSVSCQPGSANHDVPGRKNHIIFLSYTTAPVMCARGGVQGTFALTYEFQKPIALECRHPRFPLVGYSRTSWLSFYQVGYGQWPHRAGMPQHGIWSLQSNSPAALGRDYG